MGSVGQRAAKLLSVKLWERFDPGCSWTWAYWCKSGRGQMAHFFLRPPTLTASNFEALWSTDLILTVLKDLNPLKKYAKHQEPSYNFRLSFVCSKNPHFNSNYQVKVRFSLDLSVCMSLVKKLSWQQRNLGDMFRWIKVTSYST